MPRKAEKSFICSVCKSRRQKKDPKGRPNFYMPANGEPICNSCEDARDKQEFGKGRITLGLVQEKGKWFAQSRTGRLRFELANPEATEGNTLAAIAKPTFTDKEGKVWHGRTYLAHGQAHFQREGLKRPKAGKTKAVANGQPKKRGRPSAELARDGDESKPKPANGRRKRKGMKRGRKPKEEAQTV